MSAVGTQCGVRSTKTGLKNDKFEIKIPEFRGSAENSHACLVHHSENTHYLSLCANLGIIVTLLACPYHHMQLATLCKATF